MYSDLAGSKRSKYILNLCLSIEPLLKFRFKFNQKLSLISLHKHIRRDKYVWGQGDTVFAIYQVKSFSEWSRLSSPHALGNLATYLEIRHESSISSCTWEYLIQYVNFCHFFILPIIIHMHCNTIINSLNLCFTSIKRNSTDLFYLLTHYFQNAKSASNFTARIIFETKNSLHPIC